MSRASAICAPSVFDTAMTIFARRTAAGTNLPSTRLSRLLNHSGLVMNAASCTTTALGVRPRNGTT